MYDFGYEVVWDESVRVRNDLIHLWLPNQHDLFTSVYMRTSCFDKLYRNSSPLCEVWSALSLESTQIIVIKHTAQYSVIASIITNMSDVFSTCKIYGEIIIINIEITSEKLHYLTSKFWYIGSDKNKTGKNKLMTSGIVIIYSIILRLVVTLNIHSSYYIIAPSY